MTSSPARCLYGLAAIGLGAGTLLWPNFIWLLEPPVGFLHVHALVACIAIIEMIAGAAILFARTARAGAAALAILYLVYGVLWLPLWLQNPKVFDSLGNAFEELSLAFGALIVYGATAARIGYYGFGVSVATFALYQLFELQYTALLVPKWIPPGQMFWTILTTVAFALASIALLIRRAALLAARLTAAMIAGFGLLIWIPATVSDPRKAGNWSETALNFGICAAAWIVADYLAAWNAAPKRTIGGPIAHEA